MSTIEVSPSTAHESTTQQIINDFSIQVATVNGSGSQTANLVLLRSILSMGVPVSGKNMFPSNIAGLPTWYTIRAMAALGLAWNLHPVPRRIYREAEATKARRSRTTMYSVVEPLPPVALSLELAEEVD